MAKRQAIDLNHTCTAIDVVASLPQHRATMELGIPVMLLSNAGCWYTLLALEKSVAERALSGWCVFYWLWAVKNRVLGPLKQDAGVVTFGIGAAGCFMHFYDENLRVAPLSLVLTSCGFATLNYALPVANMARVPARDRWTKTARRMGRSEGFARFFFAYCLSNLVFWPSAFVLLHPKLKGRPFEDNYFVYTN